MSLLSYDIDFQKWIKDNLHYQRRKPKRIALLMALAKRLRDIHAEFIATHEVNKETMKWTGQTIMLERLLNLKFGNGITIQNLDPTGTVQIEYEAANQNNPITYLSPEFANPVRGEAGEGLIGTGFLVNVPAAINFSQDEMKAVINKYLINYKTYVIQ